MFNSFVDGTKSGIEMTAVCNATGLSPQTEGLGFPPATRFELAEVCKPKSAGGALEKEGVTEVTSSVYRDGRDVPHHLALGTYVVIEGEDRIRTRCFSGNTPCCQFGSPPLCRALPADPMIGLEAPASRLRARRSAMSRPARRRASRSDVAPPPPSAT
jgi:hypothetical protein